MFNIGKLKELIKDLYLKISFMCCCKSNCTLQVGKDDIVKTVEHTNRVVNSTRV